MAKIAIIVLAESSVSAKADVFQKGLARNPPGEAGVWFIFVIQSSVPLLPRMAKTMTSIESTGTDFITIAFVPRRKSAGMCCCLSCPVGF